MPVLQRDLLEGGMICLVFTGEARRKQAPLEAIGLDLGKEMDCPRRAPDPTYRQV